MCGIVITPASVDPFPFMDLIKSRGPDGNRIHHSCGYRFCFCRLSIVATTAPLALQPYEDDEVIVMFNGELYNWDSANYSCEVEWLAALAKQCRDFPRMLDGQFFAVVYYKDRKEFVFARDPLGIIPGFFYRGAMGTHIFSEKLTPDAKEVKPGFIYRLGNGGGLQVMPYWLPSLGARQLDNAALGAALAEAARKIRRHADCPVSFALGGLDSMVLLKLLKASGDLPDEIFTVGLSAEGDVFYARKFCDWLGVELQQIPVSQLVSPDWIIKMLSARLGEDLKKNEVKHWGALRAALVAQAASNKVIISGDGADELFYGYPYFRPYKGASLAFKGLSSLNSMHKINLDRTDRAGMLFSKEYRPPYLDRFFVDWMLTHERHHDKLDLRCFAEYIGIPDQFVNRPKWGADETAAKELIDAK